MALVPSSRYPAQTDPVEADAGYPHGKARNSGAYQDGTGTPLERDWVNDLWDFQQALLVAADIEPSGDPDEVGASQYLEALQSLFGAYTPTTPANWPDPDPTTVAVALDKLAEHPATHVPYTPATAGNWPDPDPAQVAAALDGLAARVTPLEARVERVAVEIIDDFTFVIDNSGASVPHVLSDSGPWRRRDGGAAGSISGDTADPANGGAGALSMQWQGGSAVEWWIAKESATIRYGDARMTARARVRATTAGMAAEIGFTDTADSTPGHAAGTVVSAYFNASLGNTWRIRTRGASESVVDTGVAVDTSNYQRLVLQHNGSTWTLSVDGGSAVSAGANVPSGTAEGFPFIRMAGSGSSHELEVDLAHFRSTRARWT